MASSFNNLRVGKCFRLTNFGEVSEFEVIEILADGDCKLRDLHTLEHYTLYGLINFGKGEDFDVEDL